MAPLHPHLDGSLTLAVTVGPGMLLTGVWSLLPWDRGESLSHMLSYSIPGGTCKFCCP